MIDKEKQTFTNRHGRSLAVTDSELKQIDLDDKPAQKQSYNSERPQFIPKKGKSVPKVLFMTIALAVISAGVIAAATEWDRYNYDQTAKQYDEQIVLAEQSLQSATDDAFLSDLEGAQVTLKAQAAGCAGVSTVLTALNPRAVSARDACEAARQRNITVSGYLETLHTMGVYVTQVNGILQSLPEVSSEFAVLGIQRDAWLKVQGDLAKVNVPTSMSTQHKALSENVKELSEGWQMIVEANADRSEEGFVAAEDMLTAGYERLRSQATVIDRAFTESQKALLEVTAS